MFFEENSQSCFLKKHDSANILKLARLLFDAECPLYLCIVLLDSTESYCGTDTFNFKFKPALGIRSVRIDVEMKNIERRLFFKPSTYL